MPEPVISRSWYSLSYILKMLQDRAIVTIFFFSYACHEPLLVSHETASSSAECSQDKPPFSFVRGQDSTMWNIVLVSPQGQRSVSVNRHFSLQAPQCPSSVQKRFSRDHCCRGRSRPGCRIVGSHTGWELTTWADFQLCLHPLLKVKYCWCNQP